MKVSVRLLLVVSAVVGLDPVSASSLFRRTTSDDAGPGTCGGGNVGNKRCANPDRPCCSKWGYCGTDPHHCDHLASDQDGGEDGHDDIATRGWFDCWHVFGCDATAPAAAEDFNSYHSPVVARTKEANPEFRWSCTGGGWRAMFSAVGFVNLFQQAGIMGADWSNFGAIATNSGGSWFSTQLFYSEAFYKQTVMAASPDDLYDFTVKWMDTYTALIESKISSMANTSKPTSLDDITNTSALEVNATNATETGANSGFETLEEIFELAVAFNGDWAQIIYEMIGGAAADYGHEGEGSFSDIVANAENRLPPLQQTDLLIQAGLSPTARIRSNNTNSTNDLAIYLGPAASTDLYSVPISAAYTVNGTYTGFQYGTMDSSSPSNQFETYTAPNPKTFAFSNWNRAYDLFKTHHSRKHFMIPASRTRLAAGAKPTTMPLPFAGGTDPADNAATVNQASSISSAAGGGGSPAIPSTFAQVTSIPRADMSYLLRIPFDAAVNAIYRFPLLDKLSICAQWPKSCGSSDGWFLDGAYVDNAAFAIDIAQYHKTNTDLSATLKIVLTNTNNGDFNTTGTTGQILQFFSTSFNQGVKPGDYVWPTGQMTPVRSQQCFSETMDHEALVEAQQPLEGSNMTYSILTGTTIDNPSLGIRAGQTVEVLLLNVNVPITTFIVTAKVSKDNTVPLAENAKHIASNQQLKGIIEDFFFGEHDSGNGDKNATTTAATTNGTKTSSATTSDSTASSPTGSNETKSSGTGEAVETRKWSPPNYGH